MPQGYPFQLLFSGGGHCPEAPSKEEARETQDIRQRWSTKGEKSAW
jgi:hypothetical protein